MNNPLHTKHEIGIHLPHETINGWRHPATRVTTAALIAAGAIGGASGKQPWESNRFWTNSKTCSGSATTQQ